MQRLAKWTVLICSVQVIFLTTGCILQAGIGQPAFRYETDPIEKSVDFEGCQQFEAKLKNGSLTIEGWDKPTVAMTARVCAKGFTSSSAKLLAEATKVELKRSGDKIIAECIPATPLLSNERVEVSMIVHLPFEADTTATTAFGDLAVTELAGKIKLKTGHGSLVLTDPAGPVECHTRFGDIKVTRAAERISCSTNHGKIQLDSPAKAVTCSSRFGAITVTEPGGPLDCKTNYGEIRVTLDKVTWKGQDILLDTRFGKIRLNMATKSRS